METLNESGGVPTGRRPVTIDWLTGILVLLLLLIVSGAITVAEALAGAGGVAQQQSDVELAGLFVAIIVVQSLVIVWIWRYWKRLSARLRRLIKWTAGAGVIVLLTIDLHRSDLLLEGTAVGVVLLGAWVIYTHEALSGVKWIIFDGAAVLLAIGVIAVIGRFIAPVVIVPILVGLLLWDHLAVNLSDVMADLVEFSSTSGLPNHLVIPDRLVIDWNDIRSFITDPSGHERPPGIAAVIGVGDFVIPGVLTVSVWVSGLETIAAVTLCGTVVAMVALRHSMEHATGGLPALPWLNTGALVGFVVGIVVTATPVTTALGL